MKTNYKIMIVGVLLFVLGMILMLNKDYRNFLFDIHPDLEIVGFLALPSTGLVITGVGIMLEFARRKYEMQK
ncbi:MAG: hypothetical protein HZA84_02555 [Thaumarchaeota archaeon]|nr:hypothetical protein [Nitrososphaerota archaeon]